MRCLQRVGLALCGLALPFAAPTGAGAQTPSAPQAAPHKHGLFRGARSCTPCQLAELHARGVHVPPPPTVAIDHPGHNGAVCHECQGGTVTMAPGMPYAPAWRTRRGGSAPGYAVVGEPNGGGPAPIGAVNPRFAMSPFGPGRPGSYDHSVVPTSIPPAPQGITGTVNNRPQVLGHLFGVTGIGRDRRDARERRREQAHASISYDPPNQNVTELPASMVYGRR